MKLIWILVLMVLVGCAESQGDNDNVKNPFSPPIDATIDRLLLQGYDPIKENVDVPMVRRRFSDSVNLYFQFDKTTEPAEFFISEIVLPMDSSRFLKYLNHYDCEIVSRVKKVDSESYSFYVRNNSNHMFFSSSLTRTDSALVLQNIYSMPYLSKTLNDL